MIVALHIAYHLRWDEIVRFKCLVRVMPDILSSISEMNKENSKKLDGISVTDAFRLVSFHFICTACMHIYMHSLEIQQTQPLYTNLKL